MGFSASQQWEFEGDIPKKTWKSFRTKFAKEHAPGWRVKKLYNRYRIVGQTVVSFQTTNADTAREMTADQWEFLKATLSLLTVKE
jgi:hypothetical protein